MPFYIFSQFIHRPARALAVIGGVAVGAALLVAISALGTGFRQAARAPLAGVAADLLLTRPAGDQEVAAPAQRTRGPRLPFGSAPFTVDEVTGLAAAEGVAVVAGALEIWDFGASQYQTILGIDPAQDQVGPGRALREGLVAGRLFQAGEQDVAVADRHYAAFFGLKPGDQVTIGEHSFQIAGIAEQRGSSQAGVANLYLPLAEAQALVGLEAGQVNRVYVRLADASRVEPIVTSLTARLGPVRVMSQDSILQVMGGVARISARFAQVAGWVGMLGGWLLAWVALAGLVAERRRDIGVMKAVGWRRRDVTRTFLLEVALLSLAGGVAGIILGLAAATVLGYLPAPAAPLSESLPGLAAAPMQTVEAGLPVQVAPATLALALVIALGGGILAGWLSARRVAGLKPAQILGDA